MKRNAEEFLNDILVALKNIEQYTNGIDFNKFQNNSQIYYAVIKNVEIIGEDLKNVPNVILQTIPETPWKRWIAMREKLTHAYLKLIYISCGRLLLFIVKYLRTQSQNSIQT